ncbi:hypothetical protein [Enterococcus saigonensis]
MKQKHPNPATLKVALPNENWTIAEIKKYLDDKGIVYKSSDTKPMLLSKVGG